jgi:uncharacterized protein YegP (UPF0339 family)
VPAKIGTFAVYASRRRKKGDRQKWRWRAVARNGKTVGTSGEAFVNDADAFTGALTAAHVIAEANGYQLVKKG